MAEPVLWAKLSLHEMRGTHEFATIPGVLGFRRPEVFRKSAPGAGSDQHAGHMAVMVRPTLFVDSVGLMRIADELGRLPDVARAVLVMGTPANRAVLAEAGLGSDAAAAARADDLVVAVRTRSAEAGRRALERAETLLGARRLAETAADVERPRSMAVGERRQFVMARVAAPELTVHPVPQACTRLANERYLFEDLDGSGFRAELPVDEDGIVLDYPGHFRRVS